MTLCGHSFCLRRMVPLVDESLCWKCPLCNAEFNMNPQQTSRNYSLEHALQSMSLNDHREKVAHARRKLNSMVEEGFQTDAS